MGASEQITETAGPVLSTTSSVGEKLSAVPWSAPAVDVENKRFVIDTVGFIKNLPHGLVAAFKSTLDAALDASLLHVIDASDPGFERRLEVTDKVLEEGADEYGALFRIRGGPATIEVLREQFK